MVRGSVCLNAHPAGCKKAVEDQIAYTKKQSASYAKNKAPKNALILGCSNGYGLASRIVAAPYAKAAVIRLANP